MAINEDNSLLEPSGQLPSADNIKQLYGDLWGTPGPSSSHCFYNAPTHSLRDTFPPVSEDEPATIDDIEIAKRRLRKENIQQWSNLGSQGQGVSDYAQDKIGNCWLRNQNLLKASRFIDAIRLRTNTFGTKVVLARASKSTDITCRRCHAQPEILGHILGLSNKLSISNEVMVEPTLKVSGSLYKPDLIVNNGERTLVVDVTIRYENRDYLKQASEEKTNKYNACLQHLLKNNRHKEGKILPIVVGSRGTLPPATKQHLKDLGFKDRDMHISYGAA
ncbi:uncharacterized protein LOC108624220 [Ceratina calcarata]|uniref:Uncharacterized protein LOC108624220 n=1 Tax=Ceratina calcarata TaxID=156304 RepID=A0AAJ7IWV2_9HYME|nr:uncharacterized protein LOC108624220 [Ceratina calcarata]